MSRNISKLDQVLEALYLIYGGFGKTQLVQSDGETTVEGQIASIEVREDATVITELYEEGNTTDNVISTYLINSPTLLKGIDSFVNGTKGFSKVVFTAGSLKVNFKS